MSRAALPMSVVDGRAVSGQSSLVVTAAGALIKPVRDAIDRAIPRDFARDNMRWTRGRHGVSQAIRLSKMRHAGYDLPWETLSLHIDVWPSSGDQTLRLVPRFSVAPAKPGGDDGFGFDFRYDDPAEVTHQKTTAMCDQLPLYLSYLEHTATQDGFLAAMRPEWSLHRLEAVLLFERRDDVAEGLDQMEWAPRPDLFSAGWYSDLHAAEIVLRGYELLGAAPSTRWMDMIQYTLSSIGGKPNKANATRHEIVTAMFTRAAGTTP